MKLKEYKEKKMQEPEFASAYAEVMEKKMDEMFLSRIRKERERRMREQWNELKETIIELRDNKGTCTQQEVCQFLANYMSVLEAQMEQIKGKSLDEITEAHEQFGYEKGYRDGYAQAVEMTEQKKGKWIRKEVHSNWSDWTEYTCSLCGTTFEQLYKANFCPNCGAEMEE